jgi:hypothetical protein
VDDGEVRAMLAMDRQPARGVSVVRAVVRLFGAIGVAISSYLAYLALWFHLHMDPIVGIWFVGGCALGAAMLGLPSLYAMVTGRITGPGNPFL